MKIMVCIWGFDGGGAERVGITLSNALASLGHEVALHVSDGSGPFRRHLASNVLLMEEASRSHWRGLQGLRQAIGAFEPDIVLSHQTPRNCLAILANLTTAGREGRRVFVVEHGEMRYNSRQKGLGRRLYYWLSKILYPLATGVLACSENVAQSARDYVGPRLKSVSALHNPVIYPEMAELSSKPADHIWLKHKDTPIFLGVGRLVDQKNFALLIDAFVLVRNEIPARLVIVGEGAERPKLEAQIRREGLESVVDLAGFTDNPFPFMKGADVLVLSSRWEGLPTVAIEAMYCGAQVVSTDNSSGIHEILDGGRLGWIVAKDDEKALAGAMLEALRVPKPEAALIEHTKNFEALVSGQAYIAQMSSDGRSDH